MIYENTVILSEAKNLKHFRENNNEKEIIENNDYIWATYDGVHIDVE